jgi:hypothetical protein
MPRHFLDLILASAGAIFLNPTMKFRVPLLVSSLFAFLLFNGILSAQVEFDPIATTLVEETKPEPMLRFKYRLVPNAEVSSTEVAADGKPVEFLATPYADNPLNISALLILIDNSQGTRDFPRTATLEANKQAVLDIINRAPPRVRVGLSTFANDLVPVAPIGAPTAQIRAALPKIKPEGLGTRLYLRGMDAISQLATEKAERKALLIFSDGKDEDTGYTLDNLLEAAKKSNIIILTVGCPERQQDVPALGNLQKLASETYGFYEQMQLVNTGGRIVPKNPPKLAESLLGSLDGGGEVVASLKEVAPSAKVTVTLTTKEGQKLEKTLDRAPAAKATPSATPSTAISPSPTASPSQTNNATTEIAIDGIPMSVWIIVAAAALLGLVIIIGVVMASGKKKPQVPPAMPPSLGSPVESAPPARSAALAHLVLQDADSTRLAITKTASRIGRRADNDIVFSNDSVSGHHAELHMGRDGAFTITDLNSGNGVLVNGSKVTQSPLRDGDSVELGEVRFRFSIAG